jgi:hypothetical protein
MLKRRSRIVSFRLSDEEYDALKIISATRGARSVSEFTRSVACNMNEQEHVTIEERLRILNDQMEVLDRMIQSLAEIMKDKSATDYTNSKTEEWQ